MKVKLDRARRRWLTALTLVATMALMSPGSAGDASSEAAWVDNLALSASHPSRSTPRELAELRGLVWCPLRSTHGQEARPVGFT